jgi:hypothetical protein
MTDWFNKAIKREMKKYAPYQEPTLREVINVMEKWELITGRPVALSVKGKRIRPVFINAEPVVVIDK